jgi:hypothetical protein
MIDVHINAPLQGPSALVHIDLLRIYMMTRFCSQKKYEQTGTNAFIFSGITLKLWLL